MQLAFHISIQRKEMKIQKSLKNQLLLKSQLSEQNKKTLWMEEANFSKTQLKKAEFMNVSVVTD